VPARLKGARHSPARLAGNSKKGETMAMMFTDPFETLFNLQQALDSFRTSGWLSSGPSGTGSYPPVNVFRKGDDFVILTELPGVRKSDLNIQVKATPFASPGSSR
jgi:HSP20 family protein